MNNKFKRVCMMEFETTNGNMYMWNDEVGIFVPFSDTMKAVRDEIYGENATSLEKVIKKLDFSDKGEITYCYNWLKKWEKVKNQFHNSQNHPLNSMDIKKFILREGLKQLTLCITEDCNFRCKFCIYSDDYDYTRVHSGRKMSLSIAKKAIDYYLTLIKNNSKYNPIRKPAIGFYGGEPLLNFNLIKKCVQYVDSNYENKMLYALTTNGSLLDKQKSKWLMENDFIISVSLNGPENEHDRLRVYKDGNGSYRDVMENIGPIMEYGYENIASLPVYDLKTDLFELNNFFNEKNVPYVGMLSEVSRYQGSKYYDQFTEEDRLKFIEHLKNAKKSYWENIENRNSGKSIFDLFFIKPIRRMLFEKNMLYPQNNILPFTSTCVPGNKIFVDVNGTFHICERVSFGHPIGNVDEGLNFAKIVKLIDDYFNHMDKCHECEIQHQCSYCFQHFMTKNGFEYSSKICENREIDMKEAFVSILETAEIFSEYIDDNNYFKQNNINKYWGD
jgi:uncharacterized protein